MKRRDCHNRIKAVPRSYKTAVEALQLLDHIVVEQPQYLRQKNLDQKKIKAVVQELHNIYFLWMFACFESILRHYWQNKIRDKKPPTKVLLNRLADKRRVPDDILDEVQKIRDFRNHLIHEDHNIHHVTSFTIDEASQPLNNFLARLPLQW